MQNNKKSILISDTDSVFAKKVNYDFKELTDFVTEWAGPEETSFKIDYACEAIIRMMEELHANKLYVGDCLDGISTSLWYLSKLSNALKDVERTGSSRI